jgi:DNA invertase Pin-like site-specific DNA recombinase
MNQRAWKAKTEEEFAARRAGGRRRYNKERTTAARLRQAQVVQMLRAGVPQAEIARQLQVSRTTVWRDLRAVIGKAAGRRTCPICGRWM